MNLSIDGRLVGLSVVHPSGNLMTEISEHFRTGTPFLLSAPYIKPLYVNPKNLTYFDSENNQVMQCDNYDQIAWVLNCACIMYLKIDSFDPSTFPGLPSQLLLENK